MPDTTPVLTPRLADVLHGIANGHTNKAIGDDLNLSPLTVKTHLYHLYKALGVADRAHAVATACRTGLLDPASVRPGGPRVDARKDTP